MVRTGGSWDPAQRHAYFLASQFTRRERSAYGAETVKATGGAWDRSDRLSYFLAADLGHQQRDAHLHGFILIAVNEVRDSNFDALERFIDQGAKVLLDSGIFWLTNEHRRSHGIPMDQALALAPTEIDGFELLWKRYLEVVNRFGDRSWGYIELDQGGMVNKRITRNRLHDLGLSPIPVYHPLNDGADYFDELAQGYDRICWGNVVQAPAAARKRMLATAWERHRTYPDLWIHFLGLTPNQALNAYPADSADSSTWLSSVRWSGMNERSMLRSLGPMEREFSYDLASEAESDFGHHKAARMSVVSVSMMQRGWRHWQSRVQDELGVELYPPVSL